jgi:hypothetical protein
MAGQQRQQMPANIESCSVIAVPLGLRHHGFQRLLSELFFLDSINISSIAT